MISITLPAESFEKALISNAAAIGCTLELLTEENIDEVESFAYTAYEMVRKNILFFGPLSKRITF